MTAQPEHPFWALRDGPLTRAASPAPAIELAAAAPVASVASRGLRWTLIASALAHAGMAGAFLWNDRTPAGLADGQAIAVEIIVEAAGEPQPGSQPQQEVRLALAPPDLPADLVLPGPDPEPDPAPVAPVVDLPVPELPPPPDLALAQASPVEIGLPLPEAPEPFAPPAPDVRPAEPVQTAEIRPLPEADLPVQVPPEPFIPPETLAVATPLPLASPPAPQPPLPEKSAATIPLPPQPNPDRAAQREQQRRKAEEARKLRQEARQREDTRRQAAAREAEARSAPARPAAMSSAGAIASYKAKVAGRLASSRHYPDGARSRGATGVAVVSFRVDRGGNAKSVALARSSGHADLDAETLAMVRRASPFPAPPAGAPTSFSVPINYNLR